MKNVVNKNQVVDIINEDTGVPKHIIKKVLNSFILNLPLIIKNNDVKISKFGKFSKAEVLKSKFSRKDRLNKKYEVVFKPSYYINNNINNVYKDITDL